MDRFDRHPVKTATLGPLFPRSLTTADSNPEFFVDWTNPPQKPRNDVQIYNRRESMPLPHHSHPSDSRKRVSAPSNPPDLFDTIAIMSSSAAVASNMVDLEAQTSLPTPTPAITNVLRTPPTQFTTNPVDDFFGYPLASSRTHESRHDQTVDDVLPPYVDDLPPYSRKAPEPVTLAKYLFKFGFLFPPFWIMGAFILLSPLRAPPTSDASEAWLPEKTEAERQRIISEMRTAEVKWAFRCLWALLILVVLAVAMGVAAWVVMKS